jgi:hypothetical protein
MPAKPKTQDQKRYHETTKITKKSHEECILDLRFFVICAQHAAVRFDFVGNFLT